MSKITGRTKVAKYLLMNQSVSEIETLHNNNTVQDLLYIKKLKKFDMVMAKVVMIRHGMSQHASCSSSTENSDRVCFHTIATL